VLVERFDMEELRTLATDVGAGWDNLRGETLVARAGALVRWAEVNDRLFTLMKAVIAARPGVEW
jgi:hypothetical protein